MVEAKEDDMAVWLRGTIWLAGYDEQLALAAQKCLLAWGEQIDADGFRSMQIHF
jgi:hypothetical protein